MKPRQAHLTGEQFLHRALLDLALFDQQLLQRLHQRIRIAQDFGNGLLFGF